MTIPVWTECTRDTADDFIIFGGVIIPGSVGMVMDFVECTAPDPTYVECTAPDPTYVECTVADPTWTESNL